MTTMGRRKTVQTNLPPRMRQVRNAYYYDHGIVNGKRWREPLGSDYRRALQRWAELEAGTPESGTIAEVLVEYREYGMRGLAPRTIEDRRAHIERLNSVFGRLRVEDLQPHHIARYLRRHSKPVMANREIGTLSAAISWAIEQGWMRSNPTRQIRRNKEQSRDRYVSDAEFEIVRALANPTLSAAMELAYCTGMRRGDLIALTWGQISEEGIRVRHEKTGATVLLEWTPRLREAINTAQRLPGNRVRGMTVLCRSDGQPYTADGFSAMWQRLMTKALKKGAIQERFTFHDLRAKCGTDAADRGLDSQALLGHRTEQQHLAYLRSRAAQRVTPL